MADSPEKTPKPQPAGLPTWAIFLIVFIVLGVIAAGAFYLYKKRGGGMNLPAAESIGLYRFVMEIRIPPPVVAEDAPAHAEATADILAAAMARMEAARTEMEAAATALAAARGVQLPHAPSVTIHRA